MFKAFLKEASKPIAYISTIYIHQSTKHINSEMPWDNIRGPEATLEKGKKSMASCPLLLWMSWSLLQHVLESLKNRSTVLVSNLNLSNYDITLIAARSIWNSPLKLPQGGSDSHLYPVIAALRSSHRVGKYHADLEDDERIAAAVAEFFFFNLHPPRLQDTQRYSRRSIKLTIRLGWSTNIWYILSQWSRW